VTKSGERRSIVGATRQGVFKDYFQVGIHGPLTLNGAPLNLAKAPVIGIKGYVTYINRHGGINGLKVRIRLVDDKYTTDGGRSAADTLAKEMKPFFIEGTLGIDQINLVRAAARAANIPYMAGGGPEPEFKGLGMYQTISNYDQAVGFLEQFICKYGKGYTGDSEVRLGTSTLNSANILPVEKRFVAYLESHNCVHSPVDSKARGTIQKPTDQSTYQPELLNFRNSYGGKGVNLIVPLQDPVSTSRMTAENKAYHNPATYHPRWTFANFAHDGDTELALMQGEWTGTRGISEACYYYPPQGGVDAYNPSLCAKMGEAHRQFISLGHVQFDANTDTNNGSNGSYEYNESNNDGNQSGWTGDGSGAASGYQIVYFWYGAMKSIGTDPTREKFLAALNAYNGYSDLITGPLTFAGSPNVMIGNKKFVLLEGQSNLKYRQVKEITPGLVDHF
jgi:ABC-type branched-subunit amino acid transport system substrate-binding protein